MSVTELDVDASPEHVFAVLSDGSRYHEWVVGAAEIRDAHDEFPREGAKFAHTQGVSGVGLKDETEVVDSNAPHHLRLHVKARPLIRALVDLQLRRVDSGTRVGMEEIVVGGVWRFVPDRLSDLLLLPRNKESLRRLRKLAEQA